MSGVEIAGLVFGVVPIVVEILKSYSATRDRLKAFARHAQVVHEVQLQYQVAAVNFSNDCQLLLKAVVNNARELSEMIDDPNHRGWQDPSLEERFRSFLGRDYHVCEQIIVRIRDNLREMHANLSDLDRGLAGRTDSQQKIVHRLCQAFNISRKENQYRRWLDSLDHWNSKLGKLRAQRYKLQKERTFPSKCLIRKAVPRQYSDIHTASQRLHESLQDSWSCTNVSHTGHQAKLSLDARAEYGTARLDVVIACRRKSSMESQNSASEAPIWLHVQSITTKAPIPNPPQQPPALVDTLSTSFHPTVSPADTLASKSVRQTVKKTLKRVRFNDASDEDETLTPPPIKSSNTSNAPQNSNAHSFATLDLKATESVCCHISKACSSSTCQDNCLGYLEILKIPQSFRLIFYDAGKNTETETAQQHAQKASFPISTLLQNLQILHQLTLAHRLAVAVLQHHSTSWLSEDWALENIAYFTDTGQSFEDPISKHLQSLHLSTHFPSDNSNVPIHSDQDLEELKCLYGIRNMTLAKLGVALLEIGFQKDIRSLSQNSAPHRVINARKLLFDERPTPAMLGEKYIKIAQKCIECDFSCGDNLSEDGLQSAVYTDVVCALEDMIKDWKKFLGIK